MPTALRSFKYYYYTAFSWKNGLSKTCMWYVQKLLSSPPISYLKLHNFPKSVQSWNRCWLEFVIL